MMLERSSSLVSNWISGSYFKIISDNCFLLNRVHPEHNPITQEAEPSFCVRDVCSESSWWFELPQEVQLCSFLSDCCVRGETDTASLWLFNSVFSICGEHVCPFSFGRNLFMWCVTFYFLCLVTEGRASSGVASLLVLSSLHVSFTVQLWVWRWSVLCSCWVTAPSSLFTFSDLMLICGQHGAAVFLYAVFVLLHCISFR